MPDMFEIYEKHADRYHELILAEDYANNLGTLLKSLVDWQGISVFEAGVGTGRVTQLYIDDVTTAVCTDQSQHMLNFAKEMLVDHSQKLTFMQADNIDLPDSENAFDLFIEGWSFGHSIVACADESEMLVMIDKLLANARKKVTAAGTIILMETMGTNTAGAGAPHEKLAFFYQTLVERYGFAEHVIRTDYRFETNEKAADVMGFFFGDDMKQAVLERGTAVIPEWTGVWIKRG